MPAFIAAYLPSFGSVAFWGGLALAAFMLLSSVRVAQEYQRAVVFRFGRMAGLRGPGLFFLIPMAERSVFVDLRVVTRQLESQETVTRDGVAVKVNAVVWYTAHDPVKTVLAVEDVHSAVKQASETSMRDIIGQNELDGLLKDRESANRNLCAVPSAAVAPWGIRIPESLQRAIAREAEAVREKRGRIIKAEGELEASDKLSQAAAKMAETPGAMELRRLQTLSEIGAEHNSTIVIAMPNETVAGIAATAAVARAVAWRSGA